MRRTILLVTMVLAGACADERKEYAGLELDVISASPTPPSVQPDAITLVAGQAVLVAATPLSSGRDYDDGDQLTLTPDDGDVFDVYAGTEQREFVLVGLRPGRSCLEVRVQRRREDCIDVRVLSADE
jgi:hypothetical protein